MTSVYAIDTPVGTLHAVEQDGRVTRLMLPNEPAPELSGSPQTDLARQMKEYFEGKRKAFDMPMANVAEGFVAKALEAVLAVPYGSTATYGELAAAAGSPKAARAVGNAMAGNRLPILIPCHRAVYAHGKRQSYGGGPEMKEFLLNLERGNRQ